jgi:hypothetical protein
MRIFNQSDYAKKSCNFKTKNKEKTEPINPLNSNTLCEYFLKQVKNKFNLREALFLFYMNVLF